MKALTVKELLRECQRQVRMGNENKTIMISQDDEGNGYHYLWYSFTEAKGLISKDEINENIAKYEDTIILG